MSSDITWTSSKSLISIKNEMRVGLWGISCLLVENLKHFLKDLPLHTDLEVVHHGDVSWRPLAQSVIHHRVSCDAGYAARGQNLIILIHTQRLPTKILHR